MFGIGVDDTLVQHARLLDVPNFGLARNLDGAQICEVALGVYDCLPRHAVCHAIQVEADHRSPTGSDLCQVAAQAIGLLVR